MGHQDDGRSRAVPRRRGVRRGADPDHRRSEPLAISLTPGWLAASWGLAARDRALGLPRAPPGERAARAADARGRPRAVGAILAVTGAIAVLAPPEQLGLDDVPHAPGRPLEPGGIGRPLPDAHPASALARALGRVRDHCTCTSWPAATVSRTWCSGWRSPAASSASAVVAGELGGGAGRAALAAVACATLPMAIAQASSTQNDLVASFWLLSLGYWVLRFRAAPGVGTAAPGRHQRRARGAHEASGRRSWRSRGSSPSWRSPRRARPSPRCRATCWRRAWRRGAERRHVSRTVPLLSAGTPALRRRRRGEPRPPAARLGHVRQHDARPARGRLQRLRNATLHLAVPSRA